VRVAVEGAAGRLTLNRPEALHALNLAMCQAMITALLAWRDDPAVRHVVIAHEPLTRGFCAGGDIRMLAESGAAPGPERGRQARAFFHAEYQLNHLLQAYPKPVLAVMDGVTMGGGVGISVHGRYRIATPNTLFAMPETGIGLFPDVGASWFLPRLQGELGTFLALTGARLKGEDVLRAGIATHFADAEQTVELAEMLAHNGEAGLAQLRTQEGPIMPAAIPVDQSHLLRLFGHGQVEEVLAALAEDAGEWALAQRTGLLGKSPQTLKVALRQMRVGRRLKRFVDVMAMEFRIASRVVQMHDFIEGVRALIVDKDNAPRWQHADVGAVPDSLIDAIFAPLPAQEEWQPLREIAPGDVDAARF
jgi:enoyl-CoA hydratase